MNKKWYTVDGAQVAESCPGVLLLGPATLLHHGCQEHECRRLEVPPNAVISCDLLWCSWWSPQCDSSFLDSKQIRFVTCRLGSSFRNLCLSHYNWFQGFNWACIMGVSQTTSNTLWSRKSIQGDSQIECNTVHRCAVCRQQLSAARGTATSAADSRLRWTSRQTEAGDRNIYARCCAHGERPCPVPCPVSIYMGEVIF